ncbi:MAG: acetyltransferase [Spirochaetes bacterium RBG_13_51_14]|nr:MAG: acetyltransferase [Spirochaetes bacterium RBG_13_51_14]
MFSYFEYISLFLPLAFVIYFFLNNRGFIKAGKIFLVLASLAFYTLWKPVSLPLLLLSMVINAVLGKAILGAAGPLGRMPKKIILAFGLCFNIGMLGYFKYTNFFIENINVISNSNLGLMKIMLPLGISFYTFVQISFLVDCYRGNMKDIDLLNYLLSASFFPKILQGPITTYEEMVQQFKRADNKKINYENIARGMLLLAIGLIKKLVLADNLAVWVNAGFDTAPVLNFFEAWFVSLSWTFQVYFDFSGYTDIALGIALMFNIALPQNFNSPFQATDIQELWRRWHITFQRFMRDYVYIPLGGSREGEARMYINLLITFIIGGFWHGAGWGFVLWGALNGVCLIIHRLWTKTGLTLNRFLAWFITFNFFNVTAVYFRSATIKDALKVHRGMLGLDGFVLPDKLKGLAFLKPLGIEFGNWLVHLGEKQSYFIYLIAVSGIIIFLAKNSAELTGRFRPSLRWALFVGLLLGVGIIHLTQVSEFIYANF